MTIPSVCSFCETRWLYSAWNEALPLNAVPTIGDTTDTICRCIADTVLFCRSLLRWEYRAGKSVVILLFYCYSILFSWPWCWYIRSPTSHSLLFIDAIGILLLHLEAIDVDLQWWSIVGLCYSVRYRWYKYRVCILTEIISPVPVIWKQKWNIVCVAILMTALFVGTISILMTCVLGCHIFSDILWYLYSDLSIDTVLSVWLTNSHERSMPLLC
jgi:hypothetical protein